LVGEILRKRRKELGQDLHEISKTLKIRYRILKAIEDEEFEELPEEVYVKGYIREYSKILNIDPEIAVKAYIQQISPPQVENEEMPKNEDMYKKKLKIRYVLIPALLILVITVIFILFHFSREKTEMPPSSPETKKEIPPPSVETKPEISPTVVETFHPAPQEATGVKPWSGVHVLEIFATDTTWFSVNIDNTSTKDILLKPEESVKFQAKNGFSLKIGNAGGVKLIFDGKEIGKLGEKNQVIKLNLPLFQR
jgi:cytoskeleton protein RodZ